MFRCVFVRVVLTCQMDFLRLNTWPSHIYSPCSLSLLTVALRAPEVQPGHILFSSCSSYSVLELIGDGCFGKVARCQNLTTNKTVAIKILKDTDDIHDPENEEDFWSPFDSYHIHDIPLLRVSMLQQSMHSELLSCFLFSPQMSMLRDHRYPKSKPL